MLFILSKSNLDISIDLIIIAFFLSPTIDSLFIKLVSEKDRHINIGSIVFDYNSYLCIVFLEYQNKWAKKTNNIQQTIAASQYKYVSHIATLTDTLQPVLVGTYDTCQYFYYWSDELWASVVLQEPDLAIKRDLKVPFQAWLLRWVSINQSYR